MTDNTYKDKNFIVRGNFTTIFDCVHMSLNARPKKISPLIQIGLLNLSAYYYYLDPFIQSYFYMSSGSLAIFSFIQFINQ